MNFKAEGKRATELLHGKVISSIMRNKRNEMIILFSDGTRLFVDCVQDALELSITGGGGD